ncbi:hypothetical protein ASF39_01895 [Methylobacterium sp. Leaf108]|nr:hypothetical protein ASF39_01895 [Methylobacterium sp. Leaf108]
MAGSFSAVTLALTILQQGGPAMSRTVDGGSPYRSTLCRTGDGRLTIADAPAGSTPAEGCRTLSLPVPPASVAWVGAVARSDPPGRDRLVLSGTGQGAGFTASGAGFEEPPAPSRATPLALDRSLIPAMTARTFGVEERAVVSRTEEAVTLRCGPGVRPAGVVLDPGPARLPDGARLTLRWHVTGDPGFSASVAGPASEGEAAALPMDGRLDRTPPAGDSPRFVLACPPSAGTTTLLDLRLVSQAANGEAVRPPLSAWAWRPHRWREAPDDLVAEALARRITRLFVSVAIAEDTIGEEARFSTFVGLARASGIAVAVVEGDPGMALDEGRAAALRRLGALVAYQRRAAPESRLAGVQYDIEPYLLPGFQADPDAILRGWATTLDALSAAADPLDLDLVLPFWLPLHPAAGLVMPAVGRGARRVTVMAYRTTPAEIVAAAEPLLAWTASAALSLHVALEAGPVADETARTYRPADSGDLLLLPQAGGDALALLLTAPIGSPASGRIYALERESVAPASRVSFLGDRQRLDDAVAQISTGLSAWPSFSGLALHGVID